MKRIFVLFGILISAVCYADTETINWYVDDTVYATNTCTTGGDINVPTPPTKHGYDFTGWVSYTPIEYLESTGAQYIDTGVVVQPSTKIKTSFEFVQVKGGDPIFGIYQSSNDYRFYFNRYNGSYWRIGLGGYYEINGANNLKHELEFNYNGNVLLDGVYIFYGNSPSSSSVNTLYIFSSNENNQSVKKSIAKIYYFQIYNNDVLIRDFIPVLDSLGTPCLYDKVTDQFFYNSGVDNFNAGPSLLN